ncbi:MULTISPECIES: hypothetical protein [Pseudomonas]|uniref:Lipoprotein n=1 Tax=Pseudomonas fluorescens TaxID=294 RepID=A0A5E6XEW6_PSEFL|nr:MULTISPECIES: hypothetical protein [Pseudomonas]VVN39436.1 hypothetical protein PS652_05327 [Pseudomonas fluorescens]
MRYSIIAVLICASLQTAVAADLQPRLTTPLPGAPGTATPTPYPQVTPSTPPRAGDAQPGSPLLPPMPLPNPPKDQPLPGLDPGNGKGKGD